MTVRNIACIRIALLGLVTLFATGCGSSNPAAPDGAVLPVAAQHDHQVQIKGHDHSGWWCAEHGVPEGICSQCSSKAAADFQKKGDWCADHDRAKSQCFLCNPSLKDKFAAQYRAKEGHEPPAIKEEPEADANTKS